MKKYDPDESITCPKCGRIYKAKVMGVRLLERNLDGTGEERLGLSCSCGWWTFRRPLDYEGDD